MARYGSTEEGPGQHEGGAVFEFGWMDSVLGDLESVCGTHFSVVSVTNKWGCACITMGDMSVYYRGRWAAVAGRCGPASFSLGLADVTRRKTEGELGQIF